MSKIKTFIEEFRTDFSTPPVLVPSVNTRPAKVIKIAGRSDTRRESPSESRSTSATSRSTRPSGR
jgi:hypothetical protein